MNKDEADASYLARKSLGESMGGVTAVNTTAQILLSVDLNGNNIKNRASAKLASDLNSSLNGPHPSNGYK